VELHCHSALSLLDGASLPEALVARAVALGYPALALTDHDELGGVVRFAEAAREAGLEGILGVELTVLVDDAAVGLPSRERLTHLTLLAESREGYGNASTLVTRARMDQPRGAPRVTLETLAMHVRGLHALSGCPRGWVPQLLAEGHVAAAARAAGVWRELFGGAFALECWDHRVEQERRLVRQLIPLAARVGVPWVVTNDVHYAEPGGRIVHDVLACLRHDAVLDTMGTKLRPSDEWHLKDPARVVRRWRQAPEGVRQTLVIAERCRFRLGQLTPSLPAFPLPPGVSADEYLERLVATGADERWGARQGAAHRAQLAHELALITRLGLAGFFLIVWDIVRFARREGILCQGRGSAANSAVCYCLGITAVDPVGMRLLFERFLSEDRQEPPDIDLDIAHRDRERVLQYVYERYGREHAAMVCEQITWRGRSAVRDAARVLGFSVEQADRLSALSDRFSARATAASLRLDPAPGGEAAALVADPFRPEPFSECGPAGGEGHELIARRPGRVASAAERTAAAATAAVAAAAAAARDAEAGAQAVLAQVQAQRLIHGTEAMQVARAAVHKATTADPVERDATTRVPLEGMPRLAAVPGTAERLFAEAGLDPADARVRVLADVVDGLHQLPRHRSIHVGGFILTREPLAQVVPIEPASMPGRTVIQWEKDDLDPVGLVKIDLLGLGMLTVIQDALQYIRRTRGVAIDLATLDYADAAVYDMICAADTIGVFQIESRAQMNTLPRLRPRCFYDLVVEVALIRPGPIQGEMVHPYLRRRAGLEPVTYVHPSLVPALERTLGIPLFQEQGMQVAIAAAGFTPGEADQLRRAMGHKRSRERMAAICERLIAGMARNGIPEETARRIYQQINAFADYGFPESHAASFALLVYASAYLKHYYAPEFTAALLNAQPMGFYSPGTLLEDARRHGVEVRPVDATRSRFDAVLELDDVAVDVRAPVVDRALLRASDPAAVRQRAPAVRLGYRLVRGLGGASREALERAVVQGGPFRSIGDLVARSGLDQRALRVLAESGALDVFVPDEPQARRRRAAVWRLLEVVRGAAGPLAPLPDGLDVPAAVPAMTPVELTAADYRVTGVSLLGHPMVHLRPLLGENGVVTAREAHGMADGVAVAVAGLVICRQRPGTARGFVFLTLEDETGWINIVVTPSRFERQAAVITGSPLLLVRGVLQVEGAVVNVRGARFRGLRADAGEDHARGRDFR
jgi:error-prone DNA polymerase